MDQKVKLQFSSDLEDVTKISSITLEEALLNIADLQRKVIDIKATLKTVNVLQPEQREKLKSLLLELDSTRILMSKIDMRVGDVASIVGGLSSFFDKNVSEQKEEIDVNIDAG
jgi:hypothetical protein